MNSKRLINWICISAGVLMAMLFIAERLPGLCNGLWEDEIHYNFQFLDSPNIYKLWGGIAPFLRPMLDYAVRKWFWFSSVGFSVNEKNLALVSLVYSAIHLFLCLLFPWTRYISLRITACLLLGFCSLETRYSAEAQGYSFASLAATILILSFLSSGYLFSRERKISAIFVFMFGWTVALNAHFFLWQGAFVLALFWVLCLYRGISSRDELIQLSKIILVCTMVSFLLTLLINKPPLVTLLRHPPSPSINKQINWNYSWSSLSQAWTWLGVNGFLYALLALSGLVHPERQKKYLSWALIGILTVAKFCLIAAITRNSNYEIHDRYLIMFVAPSIFALMVGMESLVLHVSNLQQPVGRILPLGLMLLIIWPLKEQIINLPTSASQGVATLRIVPNNYSANYFFFKKAKSFQRPTLVLTNHCWAADIPKIYLHHLIQTDLRESINVISVRDNCETIPSERKNAIRAFNALSTDGKKVVLFYEKNGDDPNPCDMRIPALYKRPGKSSCVAIFNALSVKDFLSTL